MSIHSRALAKQSGNDAQMSILSRKVKRREVLSVLNINASASLKEHCAYLFVTVNRRFHHWGSSVLVGLIDCDGTLD